MTNYRSKTCCVVDNGLFLEVAITLAKDFGKVLYYMPWQSGYPTSNVLLVGHGIPGVTRIDSFWPLLDEIDLFVFPDVYEGPLQEHLASLGKRVWGSRNGDQLELFRADSKKHMKSLGIDIGPWKLIKGIDKLREHLEKHDDQWVKISRTRGDFETFHAENYDLVKPKIDELEHQLGAKGEIMEFIVEEGIPDAVEIAYDGFTIDGKFAKNATFGIEVKDKGLVTKTTKYDALPEQLRTVNDKLKGTLAEFRYRNFLAVEMRITKDGTPYVIDPCCRAGSPPSELLLELICNWADIMWEGAEGTVVEPVFQAKWGAELLLISDWGDTHWQPLQFPKSIREQVKLRYAAVIDGTYYVVPQASAHPEIGAVVATGDTMDAAIKEVCAIAEKVKGFYVEVVPECLDEAQEQFDKLREFGIKV
ncbi:MAG: hypothetical protein ABSA68_13455 [Xanthobacteraceae bacterium]|jgi:hypothetical protein